MIIHMLQYIASSEYSLYSLSNLLQFTTPTFL